MKLSERPRTGAERQAEHAARRRRLSPLERDLRLEADQIYADDELLLLARIRRSRDQLLTDCARLNRRLRARLLAMSMTPGIDPEEKARIERIQRLLERRSLLALPEF